MSILQVFSASQFDITANAGGATVDHAIGRMKLWKTTARNKQVNAAGLADRYELFQNVRQGQQIEFEMLVAGPNADSGGEPIAQSTDITLWDVGGTAFLGLVQSGSIEVTSVNKDGAGIASPYEYPVAGNTRVRVIFRKLIAAYGAFMDLLMSNVPGTNTAYDVTAAITFAGEAFTMPMTLAWASQTLETDGVVQLEDAVLTGKGAPTGPDDNSLLGNILMGSGQVVLATDTGGGSYATPSGYYALITQLTTKFEMGDLIRQSGTFAFQGACTYGTS